MTNLEEIFVKRLEWMYESIRQAYTGQALAGPVAICLDALRAEINKVKGVPGARTEVDNMPGLLIGLTHDDISHMYNGGTIHLSPSTEEFKSPPIRIFLGGTHEHMAKGMAKHPDVPFKVEDTHKDQHN